MQMMRAKCRECGWNHDVVALPMETFKMVAVMKDAHCPMCGNRDGNSIADPRALTEAEAAHKKRFETRIAEIRALSDAGP